MALFFVEQPLGDPRHFDPSQLPEHGTLVRVHSATKEGGKLQFIAQGIQRVRPRPQISTR